MGTAVRPGGGAGPVGARRDDTDPTAGVQVLVGRRSCRSLSIPRVLDLVFAWLVLSALTAPLSLILVRGGQLADRRLDSSRL